jgi:hypothetical protein
MVFLIFRRSFTTSQSRFSDKNDHRVHIHHTLHGYWIPSLASISAARLPICLQKDLDTIWYNSFFKVSKGRNVSKKDLEPNYRNLYTQERGCCPTIQEEFIPRRNHVHPTMSTSSTRSFLELLEQMRNKLIVIAGDSVIQQTYNSLQVILSAMGIAFRISHKYYRYYGSAFELMEQEVCDIDHAKFQSFCGLRPNTEPRSLCNCSIVFKTIIPPYNMTIAYIFFYTIAIPESYANDAVQIKMFNHLQYSLFEHWVA